MHVILYIQAKIECMSWLGIVAYALLNSICPDISFVFLNYARVEFIIGSQENYLVSVKVVQVHQILPCLSLRQLTYPAYYISPFTLMPLYMDDPVMT